MRRVQEPVAEFYNTCRTCEYLFRGNSAPTPNGFAECWGKMAQVPYHSLDLFHVGQVGSAKFPDPVPSLLESGQASFLKLREDQLGAEGPLTRRRQIQWSHSQDGGREALDRQGAAHFIMGHRHG